MSQSTNAPQNQFYSTWQARDQLEQADQLRQLGQLGRAETLCEALVQRHPNYVAALHTLGLVYLDKANFDRALDCLVRAEMLDPKNWMTLTALSLAYLRLGANEMAAQTINRALAIKPEDASILASLGEIHREEREYEAALHAYRKALTFDGNLESAGIGLALSLSALGQYSDAARVLEDFFRRGCRSLDLLAAIGTLPRSVLSIDLLTALDSLSADQRGRDAESINTFAFVRAAALDIAGRCAEAWQHLDAANRPLFAKHKMELEQDLARQEKSIARLRDASMKFIGSSGGSGSKDPISLFILGPSRSGKTSLEHLLRTLDFVKAGGEVPIVENALRRTFQSVALPTVGYLEDLPSELLPSFRDNYLEDLRRRIGAARLFANTASHRIHDAGIIAAVIPNARFVLMRRNLQDTALRIYMTKYLRGNSYAYDLKSIATHLKWYDLMIDLASEKIPEIALVLSYEEMIADPLAALRKVADLSGLSVKDEQTRNLVDDRGFAMRYRQLIGNSWNTE